MTVTVTLTGIVTGCGSGCKRNHECDSVTVTLTMRASVDAVLT